MDSKIFMGERLAAMGRIASASLAAQAHNSNVVDTMHVRQLMFVLSTGTLGASATVDMKLQAGNASDGSDMADITGATITQIVKATGDNKDAILSISTSKVASLGKRYVRAVVTVGTAASQAALIIIGAGLRYSDAADFDAASVVEIKNVS